MPALAAVLADLREAKNTRDALSRFSRVPEHLHAHVLHDIARNMQAYRRCVVAALAENFGFSALIAAIGPQGAQKLYDVATRA